MQPTSLAPLSPSESMPALAAHYSAIGLALVPIEPDSKSPKGPDAVGWQATRPISPEEARDRWSGRHRGKGLGCVHEHSATFVLDVDDVDAARSALSAVGLDLDELLAAGVESRSPRADRRKVWFSRPTEVAPAVMAVMWRGPDGKPRKIIELRSRGQDVLPPTPYPGGGQYEWAADEAPSFFPPMPGELVELIDNWKPARVAMRAADPLAAPPRPAPAPRPVVSDADASDWDDLRRQIRQRVTPSEVLRRNGITLEAGGKCSCPFHPPDNNPSFWVYASSAGGEMWNCAHGAAPVGIDGESGNSVGDAIDLWCFFQSMSVGDATVELALDLGLALPGAAVPPLALDVDAFVEGTRARGVSAVPVEKSPPREIKPPPFPSELLRVPGFIGEMMAWNLATAFRPQPALALIAAVGLQSVLAARKVKDSRGNRTNLYLIGTSPSGSGKDHSLKCNARALLAAGADSYIGSGEIASDSGLARMIKLTPGLLIQIDEFGRVLKSITDDRHAHTYGISTAFLKLWSLADSIWLGKVYSDPANNIRVVEPCVSVLGVTVPENLYKALTPDSMSDGLLARLLMVEGDTEPPRAPGLPQPPPPSIPEAIAWWKKHEPGGGNLPSDVSPRPKLVESTPGAEDRLAALASLVDSQPRTEDSGGALWARAEEKALRLALVYACSENRESPSVTAAAMDWACGVVEHSTTRMIALAGEYLAASEFDRLQKRAIRCVRRRGGIATLEQVTHALQDLPQRTRQEVLSNLEVTGQLVKRVEPTAGRARIVYAVPPGNPDQRIGEA